ncbi:esterase/lipase/thioesterase domain-containing protein [Cavenderia fasciculata]|uniref:Esterase/lipase/thioesterase domain-containing protein n=1 Tax=Cavenderia fasciculata TaxID=261658 RepID=F4PJ12_CACFS|nr:esterase/lipase/thioesterase domain-containing protein [Cavenderia fasciculata]EGG24298.1 esterase/lipase/thioesterase domain-containing protein [Cavenderia fasciculata]|eukprot:XP_004362149.1 esterase/lipase/thioesterase domain-containing protein [Cavenderia fasciculata]
MTCCGNKNGLNVVLCHGAWLDASSSWGKIMPMLKEAGFNFYGMQFTNISLAEDAKLLVNLIEKLDGPVLLVGHSYGGSIITEAAYSCPKVRGLVYMAALAPDNDETVNGLLAKFPSKGIPASIDNNGYLCMPCNQFSEYMCQDGGEQEKLILDACQKPFLARCFDDMQPHCAWKNMPTWYQISENDRVVPPELQKFFAKRMNAKVLSLPASHVAGMAHFKQVGQFIIEAGHSVISNKPQQ